MSGMKVIITELVGGECRVYVCVGVFEWETTQRRPDQVKKVWRDIERRYNRDVEVEELVSVHSHTADPHYSAVMELYEPKPLTLGDLKPGQRATIYDGSPVFVRPNATPRLEGIFDSDIKSSEVVLFNESAKILVVYSVLVPCELVEDEG